VFAAGVVPCDVLSFPKMSSIKTVWHVMFGDLLEECKPPGFEVQREVPLGGEPQRADYLLLRRVGIDAADDRAKVLRKLWSHIRTDALLELKSPSRLVERGDLLRLHGYGCQYAVKERRHIVDGAERGRFDELRDLLLVLATPRMTPTLQAEVDFLPGVSLSRPVDGYAVLSGLFFPALVILLGEVSDAERDAVLALFGDRKPWSPEAERWLDSHIWGEKSERKGIQMENLEGYDEMLQRFIQRVPPEKRLYGLEPEEMGQVLAGLPPEKVSKALAGLPPELLANILPDLLELVRKDDKK
jgi:hypothetical protein